MKVSIDGPKNIGRIVDEDLARLHEGSVKDMADQLDLRKADQPVDTGRNKASWNTKVEGKGLKSVIVFSNTSGYAQFIRGLNKAVTDYITRRFDSVRFKRVTLRRRP